MALIEVNNVSKEFRIYKSYSGFFGTIKSLVARQYDIKKAVRSINFNIDQGELVAYIGPNGAGKSTTIKMLAGILLPNEGEILVDGLIPFSDRMKYVSKIGVVFGQRSQLIWDLPVAESFQLNRRIYRLTEKQFDRNLRFYMELLEMEDFIKTPARQLSLGQKMRANIALAWLHDPEIVYLDEPTIGLDIIAKNKIRRFIREINKEKKTTVLLTTHDMDDVEQICQRLIGIDHGRIIYDGSLDDFRRKFSGGNMLIVDFAQENVRIDDPRFKVIKEEGERKWLLYRPEEMNLVDALSILNRQSQVVDLTLKEPDIEDIVREFYFKNA